MGIWTYRIRRFLAEREVFVSLIIFGVLMMIADIMTELEHKTAAARTRIIGIIALLVLFFTDYWLRSRRSAFPIPLMFTEESDRRARRSLFLSFLKGTGLNRHAKIIDATSPIREEDLIVHFDGSLVRSSSDQTRWEEAWKHLVSDWEQQLDKPLASTPLAIEGRSYHIYPHLVLPLAFALGASVNLRRRIVLYHSQSEQFHKVIDLSHPRILFENSDSSIPAPKKKPENFGSSPKSKKLVLHIFITSRHAVSFEAHVNHKRADKLALIYDYDLDPAKDWLSYVQRIGNEARPLFDNYEEVEICLACPSVVAFALGMTWSRNPKITVCHWLGSHYSPVFSLSRIEENPPFT